jgi:hypothetical protein
MTHVQPNMDQAPHSVPQDVQHSKQIGANKALNEIYTALVRKWNANKPENFIIAFPIGLNRLQESFLEWSWREKAQFPYW